MINSEFYEKAFARKIYMRLISGGTEPLTFSDINFGYGRYFYLGNGTVAWWIPDVGYNKFTDEATVVKVGVYLSGRLPGDSCVAICKGAVSDKWSAEFTVKPEEVFECLSALCSDK